MIWTTPFGGIRHIHSVHTYMVPTSHCPQRVFVFSERNSESMNSRMVCFYPLAPPSGSHHSALCLLSPWFLKVLPRSGIVHRLSAFPFVTGLFRVSQCLPRLSPMMTWQNFLLSCWVIFHFLRVAVRPHISGWMNTFLCFCSADFKYWLCRILRVPVGGTKELDSRNGTFLCWCLQHHLGCFDACVWE